MGVVTDKNVIFQNILDQQKQLIKTQDLMAKTLTFILNSSIDNRTEMENFDLQIDQMLEKMAELDKIEARIDALEQTVNRLEQANAQQQQLFDRLEKILKTSDEENKFRAAELNYRLDQLTQSNEDLMKKLGIATQSNAGVKRYLSSLEELMRLIAANQLTDEARNDGTA